MPEGRLWLADGAVDSPRTLKLTDQTEACLCALQGAGAVRSLHHAFLFVVSALRGCPCAPCAFAGLGTARAATRARTAWGTGAVSCVW
jgi:hypothetical protein